MILKCINVACQRYNTAYQDDINRIYYTCRSLMNDTEKYMLNYICLIRHKEQVNNGVLKDDKDIQRWVGFLKVFQESSDNVINVLNRQARKLISLYRVRLKVGRPKGRGAKNYTYNGKEYQTIRECAEDYGITKQGMHKRLKKLGVR